MAIYIKLIVPLFFTAVASASIAHGNGIILNGTNLNIVQVTAVGALTCTIPGSNLPGNPIYNATVALTCGNASFTPTKTSVTGGILLVYNAVDDVLFNSSACTATITLGNIATCMVYQPNLTVPAVLEVVSIVNTAVGVVLQTAVTFILQVLSK